MSYLQYVGAIPANNEADWRQINAIPFRGLGDLPSYNPYARSKNWRVPPCGKGISQLPW